MTIFYVDSLEVLLNFFIAWDVGNGIKEFFFVHNGNVC